MTGVLDLQRRGQQIGRLRLGQKVVTENGKVRPGRLDTWRFTTRSRYAADAVAALFGGEVTEWNGEWEVITDQSSIGVTIPPRDKIVSQNYEMWSKGGAVRRCDSQTEQLSGGPCLCPHAADPGDEDEVARAGLERARLAKLSPPQACSLVTRISVMIPDLPGLGVWRLDTKSFYAAVEISDTAHLLEMAREQGVFLAAVLRIDQRSRVSGGQTTRYPVPVLEVLATFRELASGELAGRGIAAQLPPPPVTRQAIASGPSQAPPGPVDGEAVATAGSDKPAGPGGSSGGDDAEYQLALSIAADARNARTGAEFEQLAATAEQTGVAEVFIPVYEGDQEVFQPLKTYLRALYAAKARERQGESSA